MNKTSHCVEELHKSTFEFPAFITFTRGNSEQLFYKCKQYQSTKQHYKCKKIYQIFCYRTRLRRGHVWKKITTRQFGERLFHVKNSSWKFIFRDNTFRIRFENCLWTRNLQSLLCSAIITAISEVLNSYNFLLEAEVLCVFNLRLKITADISTFVT